MEIQIQTVTYAYNKNGEVKNVNVNFRTVSNEKGYINGYFLFSPEEYKEDIVLELIKTRIINEVK